MIIEIGKRDPAAAPKKVASLGYEPFEFSYLKTSNASDISTDFPFLITEVPNEGINSDLFFQYISVEIETLNEPSFDFSIGLLCVKISTGGVLGNKTNVFSGNGYPNKADVMVDPFYAEEKLAPIGTEEGDLKDLELGYNDNIFYNNYVRVEILIKGFYKTP